MLTVTNTSNVDDNETLKISAAYGAKAATVDGTTYVLVPGYLDSGVSVFRLTAGVLTPVFNLADSAEIYASYPLIAEPVTTANGTFVYVGGQEGGLSAFRLEANGALTFVQSLTDTSDLALNSSFGMSSVAIGRVTYLFVSGNGDNGISSFAVGATGALTLVNSVFDTNAQNSHLSAATGMETATVGGNHFVVVAGAGESAIQVLSVDATGVLALAGSVMNTGNTFISSIYDVATAQVEEATYVYAANGSGVSVFRLDSDGILTNVQNLSDTAESYAGGPDSHLDTFFADGRQYLATGSANQGGVSLYLIGADGTVSFEQSIADTTTNHTGGYSGAESVVVDGVVYLITTEGFNDADGVSAFSVGANSSDKLIGGVLATYDDTVATDTFAVRGGQIDTDPSNAMTADSVGNLTGKVDNGRYYSVQGGSAVIVNGEQVGTELTGQYGRLVVAYNGRYQYVPNDAAINAVSMAGATDSFTIVATGGDGTRIVSTTPFAININGAQDIAPTLTGGNIATYVDGTGVNQFNLTEGKFDTDVTGGNTASTNNNGQQVGSLDGGTGAVSFALTGANVSTVTAGGQVVGTAVENEYGRFTVSNDGRYQFVPNQDTINALPEGADPTVNYTVRVTDSLGATSTATYTVNLEGALDNVELTGGSLASYTDTAALDTFRVIEGRIDNNPTSVTNGVGQLRDDAGQSLVYYVNSGNTEYLYVEGKQDSPDPADYLGSVTTTEYGRLTVSTDGRYQFVPNQVAINALAAGVTQLQFDVVVQSDVSFGFESTSATSATFTIDLTGAHDTAPVLVGGTIATYLDQDNSFNVMEGQFDTDINAANNSTSETAFYPDGRELNSTGQTGALEGGTGPVRYALTGPGVTNLVSNGVIVGYETTDAYGTFRVTTGGRYQFVPNQTEINALSEDHNATANFSVQVTDATGLTSTATYSVNLVGAADEPIYSVATLTETNAALTATGHVESVSSASDTLTYNSSIGKTEFYLFDNHIGQNLPLTETQQEALATAFKIDPQTGIYSYNLASPDFLDAGQVLNVYNFVDVTNQRGETTTTTVRIEIQGTNEQGPASTSGDDTLNGGAFGDIIDGRSGDDIINGGGGDDIIRGGSGDDVLSGGLGHNTIDGGSGLDTGVLEGNYGDYFVVRTGENTAIIGHFGVDGIIEANAFTSVESFQFADQMIAFQDLPSNFPQPVPGGADLSHTSLIIG